MDKKIAPGTPVVGLSVMMMSSGPDLLAVRVSAIWIAALGAVLVFHCGHLIYSGEQRRWLHSAHIVMVLGMLYMYVVHRIRVGLVPSARLDVHLPGDVHRNHLLDACAGQATALDQLLIDSGADPAGRNDLHVGADDLLDAVDYPLVGYFALEMIAWPTGLCNDEKLGRGNVVAVADRSPVLPLGHRSILGDICMTVMAASMGYMFVGMQLMMVSTNLTAIAAISATATTSAASRREQS